MKQNRDYLKYLKLVEHRLVPGSVVVADNCIQYGDAMADYLDARSNFDDSPPTDPSTPIVLYAGDDFVELYWQTKSLDPNFATYEIYYDNIGQVSLESPSWTKLNEADLVGQNIQIATITGLTTQNMYGFKIRGVDFSGNGSNLSDEITVFTDENNQPPLPFDLISPIPGDTCYTLDTCRL